MTPKPEECKVCGGGLVLHGCPQVGDGTDGSILVCYWRGLQRRDTELTLLRAQLEDAGLALLDCAKERDEARGALRAFVASVETRKDTALGNGLLYNCPFCDPLNPWNETDIDEASREQFTHESDCKIGKLAATLTPTTPARAEGVGDKDVCGRLGERWVCIKPARHGGLHVYEKHAEGHKEGT